MTTYTRSLDKGKKSVARYRIVAMFRWHFAMTKLNNELDNRKELKLLSEYFIRKMRNTEALHIGFFSLP